MAKQRVLGNRYEIQEVLGEGGMAKVFLGTDRVLGRTVAVKVLSPQYAEDQQFVARFRREAQAAAALNHPNIVSVFDTGSNGNVHYIVMEYVEGKTLQEVLREESSLTSERGIEIGEAVARALSAAHDKGLVHRDIKPGNIMITREGQVKVMDFGIARATTSDTVTQTAAVLGTAAYLSPEQAQGETVDGRSDIYSLGVVLFEMLTGRQPFMGESPVSIAYRHVTEDPIPPSRINPDVPEALDAIVMKAMAKSPDERYQTAQELIDDLRRAAEGMPVAAAAILPGDTTQVIDRGSHTQVLTGPIPEEMEEEEGRRVGMIVLWTLLILAILGLASFFLVRALMSEPEPVVVPNVVGFNRAAAVQTLEAEGFEVEVQRRVRDDVPADEVFRQDPEAGTELDEGALVTIFVSRGTRLVEVPGVVGLSQEEAQQAIEDAGLVVGFVGQESSDEEPGTVISQDPQAEEEVEEGSPVNIVVSSGPETVAVPNVICDPADDARAEIEGRELVYQEEDDEFSASCEAGTVARQDPEGGAEVGPGSTVRVWISLGPSPEPSPPPEDDDDDDG